MLFPVHEIRGAHPGPRALITGGVHGDEFEPMAAIRELIQTLNPAEIHGSVTLVPVVNRPAFELGERCGPDGLDLARTCPGRVDGSITEQIAAELSRLIQDADCYLDLHTGGTRLQVQPLVGYMLHPDPVVLQAQRSMARAFDLPLIWGTDYRLQGRSLSVARDAGIPALYAEYFGGGGCSEAGVAAYVHGCRRVLTERGILRGEMPTSVLSAEPRIVEDDRPGSGHMQVNHPAPAAGYLELAVKLGDQVTEGALLATVVDELGTHSHPIHASYAGQIIVLHTFRRIAAGTSVAVNLPAQVASPG